MNSFTTNGVSGIYQPERDKWGRRPVKWFDGEDFFSDRDLTKILEEAEKAHNAFLKKGDPNPENYAVEVSMDENGKETYGVMNKAAPKGNNIVKLVPYKENENSRKDFKSELPCFFRGQSYWLVEDGGVEYVEPERR